MNETPFAVLCYTPHTWSSGPTVGHYDTREDALAYAAQQARGNPGEEDYRYAVVYRLDQQLSLVVGSDGADEMGADKT